MKPKLFVVYILLVSLPLVILGWLGARAISHERATVDDQIIELLNEQLRSYDRDVQLMLGLWSQDWEYTSWNIQYEEELRERIRDDGRITQFFCVDAQGVLVFPQINSETTNRERDFLVRTQSVWNSGSIRLNQRSLEEFIPSVSVNSNVYSGKGGTWRNAPRGQWYEWYWGDGLQLLYWWPTESGLIYGVEVNRVRLLADIVGALPDTPNAGSSQRQSLGVELLNASDHILYQWGDVEEKSESASNVVLPLSAPLGAWTLRAHMELYGSAAHTRVTTMWINLLCIAIFMVLLGIYFYRESTRDLREAEQRVNFVNHVSHELKTPLTNIRMYAELLDEHLDAEHGQDSHRLGVILSESQRLSRLIANVLTFNRKQKSALSIHPKATVMDELIRHVLEPFESTFKQKDIAVTLDLDVADMAMIDPDVAEQIIGNLLSNVEKYARSGDTVSIRTSSINGHIAVDVHDSGPGIPTKDSEAIFSPFYRVRNDLTEGVAGTGIGLSIARDLARLHGGDLVLIPEDVGAHFLLTLAKQGDVS